MHSGGYYNIQNKYEIQISAKNRDQIMYFIETGIDQAVGF